MTLSHYVLFGLYRDGHRYVSMNTVCQLIDNGDLLDQYDRDFVELFFHYLCSGVELRS